MEPRAVTLYREALKLLIEAGKTPIGDGSPDDSAIYSAGLVGVRHEIKNYLDKYDDDSNNKYPGWRKIGNSIWEHVNSGSTLQPSGDVPDGRVLFCTKLYTAVWFSPIIGEVGAIAGANEIIRKVK